MTVYALLVGINEYAAVSSLKGSVQDVQRMAEFLHARVKPTALAEPLILLDQEATRQAMIDGFESYLGQAQDGDVVFFYYSGHGSQEPAPPLFWSVEPDRRNETLVCYDSRSRDDVWDLADKELAYLIEKISMGKEIHTVVILDACHSGSATRNLADDVLVRMTPATEWSRPLESYYIQQPSGKTSHSEHVYMPPKGKHILLSACAPHQQAYERRLGRERERQGVFSYYLRKALSESRPDLTYRDLYKHVSALVRLNKAEQTPQLEAQDESIHQRFLGGDIIQPRSMSFGVSYNQATRCFVMDGGTIHGIMPVMSESVDDRVGESARTETTTVAIFPKDDNQLALQNALGFTTVLDVMATQSHLDDTLSLTSLPNLREVRAMAVSPPLSKLQRRDTYKAVVIASPMPRQLVELSGDETALAPIHRTLNTVNDGNPSLFVCMSRHDTDIAAAQLGVIAMEEEQVYRVYHTQVHEPEPTSLINQPRFIDTPYTKPMAAQIVVQQLEHIARWINLAGLTNPNTRLTRDDITLTVKRMDRDGTGTLLDANDIIHLPYKQRNGVLENPGLTFEIHNHTDQRLYAALVNLAPSYRVWPVALPGSLSTVELTPKSSFLVANGRRLALGIPDSLPETVTTVSDMFKLVVSTMPFDATILTEPPLGPQFRTEKKDIEDFKTDGDTDTLSAQLARIPFRGEQFQEIAQLSDWCTIDVLVVITRSSE
ncbi:MAG: caspase family protein [Chloroflexota bacterium]